MNATTISVAAHDISFSPGRSRLFSSMAKAVVESLGQFLDRVKREKNLSQKDIEAASGGDISGNYVGDLIKGRAVPTVKKLQALARGIGESEDLLFEIARGVAPHSTGAHRCSEDCLARQIASLPKPDQERLRPLLDMIFREVHQVRQARMRKARD